MKKRPFVVFLALLLMWSVFQGLLTDSLRVLPRFFSKLDEATIWTAFFVALCVSLWRGRVTAALLEIPLVAFIVVTISSYMINQTSISFMLLGLVSLVQYYLIYPIMRTFRLDAESAYDLMLLLVLLGLVTVPISIVQYLLYGRYYSHGNPMWDAVVGPFFTGNANAFAYFVGLIFMMPVSQLLFDNSVSRSRRDAVSKVAIIMLLLIPFFLCSGRSAYYWSPIVLAVMGGRRLMRYKFRIIIILTLMCMSFILVNKYIYNVNISSQLSVRERVVENLTTQDLNMGRLLYFILSQKLMNEYPWGNLIGVGPGTYSSYAARTLESPVLLENMVSDHTTSIPSNVLSVRTEYGYLGLAFYVLIILLSHVRIVQQAGSVKAVEWAVRWHRACVVYFIGGAFSEDLWESQVVAFFFWFVTGLVYEYVRAMRYRNTMPDWVISKQ